ARRSRRCAPPDGPTSPRAHDPACASAPHRSSALLAQLDGRSRPDGVNMFSHALAVECSTGPAHCGTIAAMDDARQRMRRGEWYRGNAPQLLRDRQRCQELLDRFNALAADDEDGRRAVLQQLLNGLGEHTQVMSRLQCDYGYLTTI